MGLLDLFRGDIHPCLGVGGGGVQNMFWVYSQRNVILSPTYTRHLAIYPFIYLSVYLSICLSIYLSIYLSNEQCVAHDVVFSSKPWFFCIHSTVTLVCTVFLDPCLSIRLHRILFSMKHDLAISNNFDRVFSTK